MKYKMYKNSYDSFKLNSAITKALKMIDKNLCCSTIITIGYEDDKDIELHLTFSLLKGAASNTNDIVRLSFKEELKDNNNNQFIDDRVESFYSEIIHFIMTNKDAIAIIYG